jgi:anti-anti-sigma regulatory factor
MDITTERPSDHVIVIALNGELDASNFEQVIETARQGRQAGADCAVIDLGGLTYMGSSGLVAIHSVAMIMRGEEPPSSEDGWDAFHRIGHEVSGGPGKPSLRLAAPQPPVDRVLDRTGMKRLFEVHPDRASAVAAANA